MRLKELVDNYSPHRKVYRKNEPYLSPKTLEWCKGLLEWADPELRHKGYIIPQIMIDDAIADDWELL